MKTASADSDPKRVTSLQLIRTFGWLGLIGFGGAATSLALAREYLVIRKRWLTADEFVEAAAVGYTLPGVIGANMAAFMGFRLRRVRGAALALTSFIFPSFVIMVGLSEIYRSSLHTLSVESIFAGINPAVAGLIAATGLRLGLRTARTWPRAGLAVTACLVVVVFRNLAVESILCSALLGIVLPWFRTSDASDLSLQGENEPVSRLRDGDPRDQRDSRRRSTPICLLLPLLISILPVRWLQIFTLFIKIGALTFGGGYVMVPLIENDVVYRFGWVTPRQFADGMALGLITPGPVAITATFIGQMAAGLPGAFLATVAIFLPSFVFTVLASAYLHRFRESIWIRRAMDGIAPAVTGLLLAGAFAIGRTSIQSWPALLIAVSVGLVMTFLRVNPFFLLVGAGVVGWALSH
ncbi:MAG: chromate efflux transporter [Acidobacteria bacterium]|nr:chromate efflux transporter [Acidobacteriota bacterium]